MIIVTEKYLCFINYSLYECLHFIITSIVLIGYTNEYLIGTVRSAYSFRRTHKIDIKYATHEKKYEVISLLTFIGWMSRGVELTKEEYKKLLLTNT